MLHRLLLTSAMTAVLVLVASPVSAEQAGAAEQLAELKRRVAELEARVAELEQLVAPVAEQARGELIRERWKQRARLRMRQDSQTHSREQLTEAERLYQVANRNWRSPEAKASLEEMVEKYPNINRTGCALVYLGQYAEGDEKIEYFTRAIDNHADCFYGDGVNVGVYARYRLAWHYESTDRRDQAAELFQWIIDNEPEAINHKGKLLVQHMPAEEE